MFSEFDVQKGKKDGHRSWCKQCRKEPAKKYRQEHKEDIRNYHIEYNKKNKTHIVERAKIYYKNHFIEILRKNKVYRNTQKGKTVDKEISKRQYEKYPEKIQARNSVHHAVRTGKLPNVKTLKCSICKEKQAEHYHHHKGYSYENRLNVIPVCIKCHGIIETEH